MTLRAAFLSLLAFWHEWRARACQREADAGLAQGEHGLRRAELHMAEALIYRLRAATAARGG